MIKKIALNAVILYMRQLFIIIITLYTSRLVLNILGVDDFGVYNVVVGLVALFGFLTSAISMSCQKIFSQQIEQNEFSELKESFSTIFFLFFVVSILILLFTLTLGKWYAGEVMNHANVSKSEISYLLNIVAVSSVFTVFITPFQSLIISNEEMKVYSFITIIEAILKLISAFVLFYINNDKLITYSIFNLISIFITFLLYVTYCVYKYNYCRLTKNIDLVKVFDIIKFLVWNIYGSFTFVVRIQGINLLLNSYFGPVANAARAISLQIFNAVNSFTMSISLAFLPSIMKSGISSNDKNNAKIILYKSTMLTYSVMLCMTLPLIIKIDTVLELWLLNPPKYASMLSVLLLIEGLISSVSSQLLLSVQASGNIRKYQFLVGSLLLTNLPIAYLVLESGFNIYWVMYVAIGISLVSTFLKFHLASKVIDFDISDIYVKVIIPIALVTLISCATTFKFNNYFDDDFLSLIYISTLSFIVIILSSYWFYFNLNERTIIITFLKRKLLFWRKHD
ncbi:hypothetical protein O5P60_000782 [Vibrio parahaemolyticus]|uniref:Polysaccharide biosynthesis protein n=1 Tax=Vibrio parahaemolyticus TaxID=670 RepID=A0A7M1VM47_VIBPH|nr:MATE family efflux transporter [Vibrio parahaemolyticus]EGR3262995.1 hypothetical protein [Vibrio parahaemolyticus]EKG9562028.1 hypothetical protein [Vibrio parahaemolyticus]EKG9661467.1 hypothetical protein [Vibrio parahaemolyticus]EKG9667365.1 hypothetical protein [Vibrio parahaemolyticus]QOS16263.1 hypothetical protein VP360_00013 [Vibrio parahaemolyticus]